MLHHPDAIEGRNLTTRGQVRETKVTAETQAGPGVPTRSLPAYWAAFQLSGNLGNGVWIRLPQTRYFFLWSKTMESTTRVSAKNPANTFGSGDRTTTIRVANVTRADAALPEVPYKFGVEALLMKPTPQSRFADDPNPNVTRPARPERPVEACSRYHGQLVANVEFHPVVAAIDLAFRGHRPLVLSPDMIWLLVAQGLANHINANPEELRPKFVEHTGRATLVVQRDDFIKGSLENPWPEVFGEFSRQIRDHIGGKTHDLLTPNFSTTGTAERAAADVVLLDAMQSFFSYDVVTFCGIPEIILEGDLNDWKTLAERSRGIGKFGLEWWTELLGPILDEFTAAVQGRKNPRFWRSIYKLGGVSGGPSATGWITAFFPYLWDVHARSNSRQNPCLQGSIQPMDKFLRFCQLKSVGDHRAFSLGMNISDFPSGTAGTPFQWKYLGHQYEMEFLAGFLGIRQETESLRIRPEIGWAVRERP